MKPRRQARFLLAVLVFVSAVATAAAQSSGEGPLPACPPNAVRVLSDDVDCPLDDEDCGHIVGEHGTQRVLCKFERARPPRPIVGSTTRRRPTRPTSRTEKPTQSKATVGATTSTSLRTVGPTTLDKKPTPPKPTVRATTQPRPEQETVPKSLDKKSPTVLTWPLKKISDEGGKIWAYQVIVIHLGPQLKDGLQDVLADSPDKLYPFGSSLIMNYTVVSQEKERQKPYPSAYIAEELERFEDDVIYFNVGSGSTSKDAFGLKFYKNVPLIPQHAYTIFLRGFRESGSARKKRASEAEIRERYGRYSSSPFHAVQETQERKTTPSDVDGDGVNNEEKDRPRNNNKASNTTGIIVAVSVGVVVVAFAAVLVVIVYKKKLDKLKAEMPSQASYV